MFHTNPLIDRSIQSVLIAIENTEDSAVDSVLKLMSDLERDVIVEITANGDLDVFEVERLKVKLQALFLQFQSRFNDVLLASERRMFVRGIKLIDDALDAAKVARRVPYLAETSLTRSNNVTLGVMAAFLYDTQIKIQQELEFAALAEKSLSATLATITSNQRLEPGSTVFKTALRRLELITRTELNRVQAIATEARMRQHAQMIPGLMKRWYHSHLGIPRLNHLALDLKTVGASETFTLKGVSPRIDYEVWGPYDPTLPANEVINCKCRALPVLVGR